MFYVYRFIDKDLNIIYVGRTINIKARMTQHFGSSGHLPAECYDAVHRVDFLELKTKSDMKIKELYYIGKYRPHYNTTDNDNVSFALNELEDLWVSYSKENMVNDLFGSPENEQKSKNYVAYLEAKRDALEERVEIQDDKIKFLKDKINSLESEMASVREWREHVQTAGFNHIKLGGWKDAEEIKEVIANNRLISYKRMEALIKKEPRLMGLRIVDGKLRSIIKKVEDEIHGITSLDEGKIYSVVMDSPIPSRKCTNVHNPDETHYPHAISMGSCMHWLPALQRKPYRKGA